MRYISTILILLFAITAIAQVKIRKTSDAPSGENRVIGWEIYDVYNQNVISSGTETHLATMMPNGNVRQMLQNILTEYLDANNISEPDGGTFAPIVKWTSGNVATGSNTNPVDLTGLSFSYQANTSYLIHIRGRVQPTAATTGMGLQFDLSSTVTQVNVSFYHQVATTGAVTGGYSIADDVSIGLSSAFPGTSTYPVIGEAWIRTGANAGTAQLRLRAEVAGVITAISGFAMIVERL